MRPALQPRSDLGKGQTATRVIRNTRQAFVQQISGDPSGGLHLVEDPKQAINSAMPRLGLCTKQLVASDQRVIGPASAAQCEAISERQAGLLLAKLLGEGHLVRHQRHDTQPETPQQRPVFCFQLALVQQVGHDHREPARKRGLQEPASLQVDQDGSVRDQDDHDRSGGLPHQPALQLANADVQQLRGTGLRNRTLSNRAQAQPLHALRYFGRE